MAVAGKVIATTSFDLDWHGNHGTESKKRSLESPWRGKSSFASWLVTNLKADLANLIAWSRYSISILGNLGSFVAKETLHCRCDRGMNFALSLAYCIFIRSSNIFRRFQYLHKSSTPVECSGSPTWTTEHTDLLPKTAEPSHGPSKTTRPCQNCQDSHCLEYSSCSTDYHWHLWSSLQFPEQKIVSLRC